MVENETIYNALRDSDGMTAAELKKATKSADDGFDEAFAEWQRVRWIEVVDPDAKTEKFRLTDDGRRTMRARYDKDVRTGRVR